MAARESNSDDEKELINAEFDSIVEGLSLDESAPTTYLDELENIEKANQFVPPVIPKKKISEQWRELKKSVKRWRENPESLPPDDGAAI